MLDTYLTQVQNLLGTPSSSLYSTSLLTQYINTARTQIALEGECIRQLGTLALVSSTDSYVLSSITGGDSGTNGVLAVRQAYVSGGSLLQERPWEWFTTFYLTNSPRNSGTPSVWSQLGEGTNGAIYFDPVPNSSTVNVVTDSIWLPINLASDSDPEDISYPWQDAVQFFACYLALSGSQRNADGDRMLQLYNVFMRRAREMITPTVLPDYFQGGEGARIASGMITLTQPPTQQRR